MSAERQGLIHNLFSEFNSDKKDHGYFIPYGDYLPEKCASLLEIGCLKGASLRVWDRLFGGNCDIHTIDLFGDSANMSVRACREAGFVPHEGSQDDINFLSAIKKQFDICIDDGSHNSHQMLISFKHLFVNNLKSGGVYCIEDLLCNFEPFYWGGLVKSFMDTPVSMFGEYLKSGIISNPYFNPGEADVFQNLIDRVVIWENKIVFIWKK
jgi:hypothetical protein